LSFRTLVFPHSTFWQHHPTPPQSLAANTEELKKSK
jgi:hypothetical protein